MIDTGFTQVTRVFMQTYVSHRPWVFAYEKRQPRGLVKNRFYESRGFEFADIPQYPVNNWLQAVISTSKFPNTFSTDSAILNSLIQSELFEERLHQSTKCKIKRLIDILGALVGLSIIAIAIIPLTLAIYFDNPGPIFYSQMRCGLKGKTFRIWKFRSMVVNAEQLQHLVSNQAKGNIFKNDNDPRVTRVGRFLRRTSLDELPQFWNVLKGEMSLVGTRPPTVKEVKEYQKHHFKRLNVKPGITGEWQANGRSTVTDFEDVVRLDIAYQHKWSVVYDIQLVFQTIWGVLRKDGAC